jgi:hypothetical protein
MSLPEIVPTTRRMSVIKKIRDHTITHAVGSSSDIKVKHTPSGTTLHLDPRHKDQSTEYTKYRGEYDPDAPYAVNDIVRVRHGVTYTHLSASTVCPATPGVFICVTPIPNKPLSDSLTLSGVADQLNYAPYIRVAGVKYFPQYPEPASLPRYHSENGRYWEYLSGLPKQAVSCDEFGDTATVYVDQTISGSL